MSESSFRKYYAQAEFVAMGGSVVDAAQFGTFLSTVPFAVLGADVYEVNGFIAVEFAQLPTQGTLDTLDAAVAAFVAAPTTNAPFSVLSAGVTTASNATLVDKIDFTTPPLDGGTYSITYTGQQRLQTAAAGDSAGVRLTITFSGFAAFFQEDEWPFVLDHAYNYAVTGVVSTGQTIRVQAQVYKLGAGAAIAEVSKARFTIDKIG